MATVGRPPKYKNAKEIEVLIDEYFKKCEGEIALDDEGKPMRNKFGGICYAKEPTPPTITGLALALGFTNRLSLLNYQGKKEFVNTITRAKSRIEAYAEQRLFDRDGARGAEFSLRNNFKGWKEEKETAGAADVVKNIKTLAEIIRQPAPDRDIEDYE